MLLNNLMEDKQLNFNQPFLSVRRYNTPTSTSQKHENRKNDNLPPVIPRLPPYKSELKSGPISNPGVVPFKWEQTPGLPKHQEIKPQTRNNNRPPIAPKLPPGRRPKANNQDSSKDSPISSSVNKIQAANLPCESRDENVKNFEKSKEEKIEEKESSDSEDSSEGEYVDALDTLSRTESFFLNCSTSGLSGLDDLDVKPSRSFSTDQKTRDFMMDRFLPAAKAMASETTPQYAPKRQSVVGEQPQQLKNVVVNKDKPKLRYGPSFAKRYSHYEKEEEEEDDESDDEYDRRGNMPGVCGLLPRFCLKSSLCLLNPVPAMSVRTRVQMSPANRTQPASSSSGSYTETENESKSDISEFKATDKVQTAELDVDNSFLEEKEVFAIHGEKKHGVKTFEDFLADRGSPKELDSGCSPFVEKSESPNLTSFYSNTKNTNGVPGSREEDHEIITKKADQMHLVDLSLEDFKKMDSVYRSNKNREMEMPEAFRQNQDFKLEVSEKEDIENLEKQQSRAIITAENSHQNYSKFPAPPALPKSPSDSWLWRTLPSTTTKNSPLRTYLDPTTKFQNQGSKAPTRDMKWETIVKTTNVQRHHLHYSDEMLTTIPET